MSPLDLPEMTPRLVILDVLSAAGGMALSAPQLARSGEMMGFTPGSMRVATSRLASEALIESPRRGEWKLAKTGTWIEEQTRWTRLQDLVQPWQQDWWVVMTQLVPRASRPKWRKHENALWHRGFVEAKRDYFIRPANLALNFEQLLGELRALGMAEASLVFRATEVSDSPDLALWDTTNRKALYHALCMEIESLADSDKQGRDSDACRHFLRVGRKAIWALNTDPLLPESWGTNADRDRLVALMPGFITQGRKLWLEQLDLA
ncbi:hypothetical protein [Tamilnaduibacter salinus]|uniref:hypothetical protein n=1 Tax=Tamilnaduibacter salinus TaxID=1484056 RepID=UPI00105769F3|nr:hypothetical protein [Tamilnaduibacter salinus]